MLRRLCDRIEWALEKCTGLLCLVLLACLFMEVMNRYVFEVSWLVLQYVIPFCFLWMCMLGAALAVRRSQHFEVDLLSRFLGEKNRGVHRRIMLLTVLAGGALIAWSSIGFAELGLLKRSPATGTPMIYIHASVLVGGALIALMALEQLLHRPADEADSHTNDSDESASDNLPAGGN